MVPKAQPQWYASIYGTLVYIAPGPAGNVEYQSLQIGIAFYGV